MQSSNSALSVTEKELKYLNALERKVLWLASWTIHNANNLRPSRDGLKVGGHQASCASVAAIMSALYFKVLKPEDRVAVKPHAAPVFHAIQYLLGKQSLEQLENFRSLGGAQSYPSRSKDNDDVDFSTGSVGLGVGVTLFASMIRDYVHMHKMAPENKKPGRMVAIMGDAELDEGNVFEAMLEGWKHDVRNLWWVIDYNRQSLDGVVNDNLFQRIQDFFQTVGWKVVKLKHGKKQLKAFDDPVGAFIPQWIDECPNDLFSALTFKGGAAWRLHLANDLAHVNGINEFLDRYSDEELGDLMTNLGGHDMETLLEAFEEASKSDVPTCFIAYTVKGFGLPLAGHKDNHAGLMNMEQMENFRKTNAINEGEEWDSFAGLDISAKKLQQYLNQVEFNNRPLSNQAQTIAFDTIEAPKDKKVSTQVAFGKILNDIGRQKSELGKRIVTTSPDVTVSTNLGGWVNQRGIFRRTDKADTFREQNLPSPIRWEKHSKGQHVELGIAENNLFLLLAAMGLSHKIFDTRLLPIGTVYDPFVQRGLDALNYACYQDARFMLIGTPSGITLGPEGGAHQSIGTPLIGMAQPGLATFEPAFADELAHIMDWSFAYMQHEGTPDSADLLKDAKGGSVYLRLSTRTIDQQRREFSKSDKEDITQGAYWLKEPAPGSELAIVYCGAIAPEALEAWQEVSKDLPGIGLLAVTSADRLYAGWQANYDARRAGKQVPASHIEKLLSKISPDASLVTVLDGHPNSLAWMGSVSNHRCYPLGVTRFGQSGDLIDLYREYGIDAQTIVQSCSLALADRIKDFGPGSLSSLTGGVHHG